MDPTDHPSHNFTFKGPEPGIGDLKVHKTKDTLGYEINISHWKPNDLELQALMAGGTVKLSIYGQGMPPVALGVEQP